MGVDREALRRAETTAARQDGQVTRQQLLGAGYTPDAIKARIATGYLRRLGRGVYAIGLADRHPRARERAALLELGDSAYLSHRTAAGLWRMTRRPVTAIEVTVVERDCRGRDGLTVRRVGALHRADRKTVHGLRVTAPARTVIDCAAGTTADEVASLIEAGRAERILDDRQLAAALDRAGRRAGVRTVKQVLQAHSDHGFTRSKAERLLRDLIRRAQLPPARHNVHVLGREVDALWPDQKLIVEVDGWQHHNRRAQFESDRARDRRLTAAGYRVIRVTWWQLVHEPVAVAASIAAALARAAAA